MNMNDNYNNDGDNDDGNFASTNADSNVKKKSTNLMSMITKPLVMDEKAGTKSQSKYKQKQQRYWGREYAARNDKTPHYG